MFYPLRVKPCLFLIYKGQDRNLKDTIFGIPIKHIVKPVNLLWVSMRTNILMWVIQKSYFLRVTKYWLLLTFSLFAVIAEWERQLCWTLGLLEDDQTNFEHKRWFHEIKVILRNKEGVESTLFASICCNQTFPSRHQVSADFGSLGKKLLVKTSLGDRKRDTSKQRQQFQVYWSEIK